MPLFLAKTPSRLQVDPIECGAVCLAIILEYFGYKVSSLTIKNACRVSRNGAKASDIIHGAKQLGLMAYAKSLLSSDLKKLCGPAILFMDQCHFIVFEGYFLGRFFINDPALGRYSMDQQSFHHRYSRVALLFTPNISKAQAKIHHTPLSWSMIALWCLGMIAGLAMLLAIFMIGLNKYNLSFNIFIICILFILLLWIFVKSSSWALKTISYNSNIAHQKNMALMLSSLTKINISFFAEIPYAQWAQAFIKDINEELESNHSILFMLAPIYVLFALALIMIAPLYVIIITAMTLIYYIYSSWIKTSRVIRKEHLDHDDISKAMKVADDIVAMGQNDGLYQHFLINRLKLFINSMANIFTKTFFNILTVGCLYFIINMILLPLIIKYYALNKEDILAIILLFHFILIGILLYKKPRPQNNHLLKEVNEQLTHVKQHSKLIDQDHIIEVHNSSVIYRGESSFIWQDLSINIKRGDIILLKGLSGKSTLMKLLSGQMPLNQGSISYQEGLNIALIDDDSRLIKASIKDNITLFNEAITNETIIKYLTLAHALDLFYNRPLGLLAMIDDDGLNLSFSERKRLLLARVLAQHPDVIILDDFFATMDNDIGKNILYNLSADKTIIFNSDNIDLMKMANRIINIDNYRGVGNANISSK